VKRARFAAAVEEATARTLAFPLSGSPATPAIRRVIINNFPFSSSIGQRRMALWSSRLRIIHGCPGTGAIEYPHVDASVAVS
jgi:hypothetical protein